MSVISRDNEFLAVLYENAIFDNRALETRKELVRWQVPGVKPIREIAFAPDGPDLSIEDKQQPIDDLEAELASAAPPTP
ncbi:MAG TPA: hypothetical protein VKE94_00225 [Gemmataceae bacterium]|nr:hypothetical protein [Gemmataceae bacterium]